MNKIMFPLWLYLFSFFLSPSQSLLQLQFCQLFACLSFLELLQFGFCLLLLLLKKLFLRENQFSYPENWPKIKFPEKSQKIQNKFFLEKRGRGTPGVTQGPPQASTPLGGAASPQVAPVMGVALQGASSQPSSFSLPKNTGKLSQARVPVILSRDF